MAESQELLLDVKVDFKDVKSDNCLKNWVNWMKCHVKIDAIECFPCYLKVSLYHENDDQREYPFSILRLNIPGVRIGSAASRTKSFTYGVFWKNNRKRCRLFLAFPDKQSCSVHMKWLKRSIDSLEFYRKDILENHRISRSISAKNADDDESPLNVSKGTLNDTLTERDMNDILGPLPEIPTTSGECCNRLSHRRSSGCSGIYEEILDPTDSNLKRDHESRGSITSGIYVDMSASLKLNQNQSAEMPPPLPPRRRIFNHVYTTIDMQNENVAKTRKSTWNLKNVFGRTKTTGDATKRMKASDVVKSHTTAAISNLCSTDCSTNLLGNCKNSFSTPDLTNIIASSQQVTMTTTTTAAAAATAAIKCEADETDLDVMDIERSNSLNCSTNQFSCRPPPLNISDNILWSHNLSLTLSTSANSSAINLVGANVNNRDSFLGRDLSGYCKMAPIIKQTDQTKLIRTSTKNFDEKSPQFNQLSLDSSATYCTMAPILPKTDVPMKFGIDESVDSNILKNVTFERTFDFDEDHPLNLDCSMKSIEHSNHASLSDITTSSGVSSYDGSAINRARSTTPIDSPQPESPDKNDDAISLTYTESPPQSAQSYHQIAENPFVYHATNFDEKLPSYFPNEKIRPIQDSTKYTVNVKSPKPLAKCNRKTTDPVAIPVSNTESSAEMIDVNRALHNHQKTPKEQIYKGQLKVSSSNKIHKLKQRRGSISDNNAHFDHHPIVSGYKNENMYNENCTCEYYKYDTLPNKLNAKVVLSHLDPNTKFGSNRRLSNFEKNSRTIKIKSSPRRIYNKCATLASRLKTPPTTPTEPTPVDRLNCSFDTAMRATKQFGMASGSDSSGNGLIRSWVRFRKIDFSPLKTKINSIWQRPTPDF